MLKFNENSRVKIPAIVHLTRLGYSYMPKPQWPKYDPDTNIFIDLFKEGISKINNRKYSASDFNSILTEIKNELENNDTGRKFYRSINGYFDCKLIDSDNIENNLFHVVTELTYKNEEEEFRPDITILINGMPLVFIEVKKPNNREGILAERERIYKRFRNPNFKRFMNITQLLIFSNNQEYDEESITPIQGAFYATPDPEEVKFNCFREEDPQIIRNVPEINADLEKEILLDNNLVSIIGSPEYNSNKDINTPTNRIITSLLSKDRLKTVLKYGIAYVENNTLAGKRIEKHIMRYPQLFATYAIENKLKQGIRKGIIWHTQGSGKTALAFFNVYFLRDYFQKHNIIAKFYFIVDRIDLAIQAKNEFESRGLKVETVNSKEDFIRNIKTTGATAANVGVQTITVVNIQKFSEESISTKADYSLNIQRIYFLDEVHRSYNMEGSFLANLMSSDRDAVMIGLTGTPLISKANEYKSTDIFGDYIHKYYYNKSIADGYTLKLIREAIETKFRNETKEILKQIETQKGSLTKRQVFAHPTFIEPLVKYIIDDFKKSRGIHDDNSIGGMIVCDSSEQARMIFDEIEKNYSPKRNDIYITEEEPAEYLKVADRKRLIASSDPENKYNSIKAALILHDADTKEIRKDNQAAFKQGEIDILVVYNMLLTGFDAKRLKKLYLTRVVKEHNLLQTLTRVNRPYKNFKYGYVVDFADIREEFDKTNREYFKELQQELGDEVANYSNIFKSQEDIEAEIAEIKEKLFLYDFTNLEEFQKAVTNINDRKEIMELKKCLENLKSLYNVIKAFGYKELLDKFTFDRVNKLYNEVANRVEMLNLKASLENPSDNTNLLNIALENIQFTFRKIGEFELKIADKFREELERTRRELLGNSDKKDPQFISLFEELNRLFKKKNIEELTSGEMNEAIEKLKDIYMKANALNNKDLMLAAKYGNDFKFARIHKRIKENNIKGLKTDTMLYGILIEIKHRTDEAIINNHAMLDNEDYFSESTKRTVMETLEEKGIKDLNIVKLINKSLVAEYHDERAA